MKQIAQKKENKDLNRSVKNGGIVSQMLMETPLMQQRKVEHDAIFNSSIMQRERNSEVIQRKLTTWKPDGAISTKDEKEADGISQKISSHVDKAYQELVAGNYSGASEKQKNLYILRLNEYQSGLKTMHPSTAAGYVIEGKVNKKIGGDSNISLQGTDELKGTRPDIIITLKSGNKALVDITAQNSLGHIFNKKGNWLNHASIPYVAEAWYPSIDFNGGVKKLSKKEIQEAEAMAKEKKEMQELAQKELFEAQLNNYTKIQNEIMCILSIAELDKITNLTSRQRSIFIMLGVEIDKNGSYVKLSFADRNDKAGLSELSTQEHPIPQLGSSVDVEVAKKLLGVY